MMEANRLDRVKDRVRKLMALANDGAASDGEIDNAMRFAAKLMDEHHLAESDIATATEPDDLTMGSALGTGQSANLTTWESALSHAVCALFGTVACYRTHNVAPIRVNGFVSFDGRGNPRKGKQLCYYGPAADAKEAADLYGEWAQAIATMGVARWGGMARGDGASYCYGFASALLEKARAINAERRLVAAKPIPRLSGNTSTAITLANRYELIRDEAARWLAQEQGIKLGSAGRRRASIGNSGAYAEGRAHGSAASFGRRGSCKLLR